MVAFTPNFHAVWRPGDRPNLMVHPPCPHISCRRPLTHLSEFEADAKAKTEELAALLSEREEEFYSYQQNSEEVCTLLSCTLLPCTLLPCALLACTLLLSLSHFPRFQLQGRKLSKNFLHPCAAQLVALCGAGRLAARRLRGGGGGGGLRQAEGRQGAHACSLICSEALSVTSRMPDIPHWPCCAQAKMDTIDYADEDEEDEGKDEM